MHCLLLLLALPFQQRVTATVADTAAARTALRAGMAALEASADSVMQPMAWRYQVQLSFWEPPEEVLAAAEYFDRRESRRRPDEEPSRAHVIGWAQSALEKADTILLDRLFERLPAAEREPVMAGVAGGLLRSGQDHMIQLASRIEARLTEPWSRAQVLAGRGYTARHDSALMRDLLVRAIALASDDSVPRHSWQIRSWMIEILRLGGTVDPDDMLRVAARSGTDEWLGLYSLADELNRQGMRHLAEPVLDTLETRIPTLPPRRQPNSWALVHNLRGTPADSAIAKAIHDSLAATYPVQIQPHPAYDQSNRLAQLALNLDSTALVGMLSNAASIDAWALHGFLRALGFQLNAPPSPLHSPIRRDSLARFAQVALSLTLPAIGGREPLERDSLLVSRTAVMAALEPRGALAFAQSIETQRFRERAIAEAVAHLAGIDARAAAVAAEELQDPVARNRAFTELAQRAVAGGRLPEATAFAARTAGGEPLVRAYLALARAEWVAGLRDQARQHAEQALNALDPNWRCEHYCLAVSSPTTPPIVSVRAGMSRESIGDVVRLALELNLRPSVEAWAASQPEFASRAAAQIALVEGMSKQLLGWHQTYPR